MTLKPIAERLTGELLLPFFTTQVCCGLDSNTQPSACAANALTDCVNAAALYLLKLPIQDRQEKGITFCFAYCFYHQSNMVSCRPWSAPLFGEYHSLLYSSVNCPITHIMRRICTSVSIYKLLSGDSCTKGFRGNEKKFQKCTRCPLIF